MSVEIKLIAEDWMMTAGLIGLTRLYKNHPQPPVITQTGLILTEEHLLVFSQYYIEWLISEFSIVKRDVGRMDWAKEQVEHIINIENMEPEKIADHTKKVQDAAKSIRTIVVEQMKKVEKYFLDTDEYEQLKQLEAHLEKINKDEQAWAQAKAVKQSVVDYQRIMSIPFINEKLTLNYAKAVILNIFFGQTSILQPTFNAKSTLQHTEQLDKDFAMPALRELQLYGELCKPAEQADLIDLLNEHSETYKPFKDWLRKVKKMKNKSDIQTFFRQDVLPCFLIPGLPASQSYEELTFSPLALSKKNAVNFSWNFDKDTPMPISALARLLLFAVPVGLTVYNRRIGTEDFNETKRFFGMILTQSYFEDNVSINNSYQTLRKKGTTFSEAITNLLDESHHKANNLQKSYLFVELHSEYQLKKTLLEYYHMPPYLAAFFNRYGKTIHYIQHPNAKDAFVRALLKGLDPKQTIYELLRLAIKPKMKNPDASEQMRQLEGSRLADSALVAINARRRILDAKQKVVNQPKGAEHVTTADKKIYIVHRQGVELRNRLIDIRPGEQDEGKIYRAGGRKKLEGIAYRLLNAAKAGDKSEFMDTVFRIYMSANTAGARQSGGNIQYMEVSSIFLEGLQEGGIDFDTIASAFISGLLGTDKKDGQSKNDHNGSNKELNEISGEAR